MEAFINGLIALAMDVGAKLLASILVFIIGRIIIKAVVKKLRNGKKAEKMDPTVSHFLFNLINVALNIILVVTIIAIMGVPMASVVAAIASAGVAIGLALQGSLSNLAGGIMILIFHPFRVGDYIEAADYSGTVIDLDIFYTFLNTSDNKRVTIPNGSVMGSAIINYSKNAQRRVDLTFNVAYGTDIERVKSILTEEADKHELVLKDPAIFCRLTKQNESSLDFTLRVWVEKDNYWQVNFDLLEAINNRFVQEGIEVPFNQIDVHVKEK
ncbi:MAG: mechanosensitive ion channel [Clostridia bacterium]|nr:mechanosensitive ion channel [Clostridia bacterium]